MSREHISSVRSPRCRTLLSTSIIYQSGLCFRLEICLRMFGKPVQGLALLLAAVSAKPRKFTTLRWHQSRRVYRPVNTDKGWLNGN